jgi:hypothetical protein
MLIESQNLLVGIADYGCIVTLLVIGDSVIRSHTSPGALVSVNIVPQDLGANTDIRERVKEIYGLQAINRAPCFPVDLHETDIGTRLVVLVTDLQGLLGGLRAESPYPIDVDGIRVSSAFNPYNGKNEFLSEPGTPGTSVQKSRPVEIRTLSTGDYQHAQEK